MNNNIYILKYILKYNIYNKYKSYINKIFIHNKELTKLTYVLDKYFEENSKDITDPSLLEFLFKTSYPAASDKELDLVRQVISYVKEIELEDSVLENYMATGLKKSYLEDAALLCLEVSEGKKSMEELKSVLSKVDSAEQELTTPVETIASDLESLLETEVQTKGLRWRLSCLNDAMGSLRLGDFGFIFKRPETGGTTFLASEVTCMAEQTDRPILWFNNEERGAKVLLRCYQAALGASRDDLTKDAGKYQAEYLDRTKGLIQVVDRPFITARECETIISRVKPSLIIYDQIDKIKGFKDDRSDIEYGRLYRWAREMAKAFAPSIGVCQASASAEDKEWLYMDDIAESKTSKAAEADWIIGIGKKHDAGKSNLRYLHLAKNKLSGDSDTKAELRHGKFTVIIRPEIARFVDI